MAQCECLAMCPFFLGKMANMPVIADMLKRTYCRGDNSLCARYKVFKAKGLHVVPDDLYPRQMDRALNIVES
ncbi:MAG: hypothetical protein D6E12_04315 [Desulfovibrio sp.]|nr:MAG: hypothetical protein D6E12_04315 [Desulfovibrio sp.]